jgi:two-component system cell cycle sensor histidine kinase/response regulator CckA
MSHDPANGPLSDREARLLSIIESAMDAIITVDESQRIVLFNPAAERIFGVPVAEALGSRLDRFIPERFRRSHAAHVGEFGRTGVTMRAMGRLGTISGLRADGTEFPIEASISQATAGGQRLFTVILRDVSERKRLQEQFLQSQKMEGIGRLAGGIAHDFNNLLMAVFNYLTLASNRLDPGHPARPAIASAHEAAEKAAMLTRQLLAFARKQVVRPRVLSPGDVVAGLEPMLRRLIGDDIVLRASLAAAGNVLADATQLEQVIVNLVVNARDAMPEGGKVTIEVSDTELDEAYCRSRVNVSPGPYVMIAVTDTGTGMDAATLQHLFEPFFTTKAPGKGTGLGLATCHAIVKQRGGHIAVYSEPGRGTTVRVFMPRIAEDHRTELRGGPSPAPVGGTESVLLVEDSPVIRGLVSEALQHAGYDVLVADSGAAALRLAEARGSRLALLITDVVMPEMSGAQLAETLLAGRPRLKVIYMSGYTEETISESPMKPSGALFISKPFTTDSLLRQVRQLLDAKGA